ncbi:dipeptidyl aminopeptidase/acylaminoacyl peptidase [Pontibacter aydingkolensis]|uniref:S9 family peptidase n=1 Tax=Pontibacter aydingkolensis TaxID=1911536 RepID=A0ABS7CX04_9BACT|nr:S9 family peptidase [Pontibacter aydingkolensis]MBW7468393.1 S9 family peptidase [Pontibacter aydingkolensis]
MKKQFTVLLLFLAVFIARAQAPDNLIKVTDMLKIKQAGAVTISPDGNWVAFTINSIEPDPAAKGDCKHQTQLHLAPTSGATKPRQLTFAKEGASQPTWSPDGKQLAFVRVADGKPQIFLLPLNGGEPMQLTKFKYGANTPRWSPDGSKLLFTSGFGLKELLSDSLLNPNNDIPKWSYEKPGFYQNEHLKVSIAKVDPDGSLAEIRGYLDKNEKDQKAKVINQLNFQEEANVSANISLSHIFIVDAVPGTTPKNLTPGFSTSYNPRFTPDGKRVVFEGDSDETEHPNRSLESEVYIVNADGSNLKRILGKAGVAYNSATLSPSGKWLAFQYNKTQTVSIPKLAIMLLDGSESDMVTIDYDRNKNNLTWASNDKHLYFTSPSNGGVILNRLELKSKKVEQLTDFNSGVNSFDIRKDKLAFVKTEVANPNELYLANENAKKAQRITSLNHDWVKDKKLSIPEKKTFKNEKGQVVEYWVMKPTNYKPGNKYPLLLEIHGGPTAMWGPGESSMWHEYQYFASRGYGVVYSNPRGSGGYGEEFMRANVADWGKGPANDVLTALDGAVDEGWADTSRLVVTGGSYGGYLVSWILGHDKRFKAACAQRGVYDLGTFFGEGNAWRLVPNYFGGYPWEDNAKGLIQRESPLTYVQNITTPLIIFHGENDLRTGVIQSEMLYKSLKIMNRPVEYVRHPGATHEITRSGNNRQRIDQMLRTYEFFERWLNKPVQ